MKQQRSSFHTIAPMGLIAALALLAPHARANPPFAKYIFPPGGQRGTTVQVKVGGCFFHGEAGFEMLGPGITAPSRIREVKTTWFEGPLIPQPASQRAEDYPKDHAATIKIAPDAELGSRAWRAWTSQGATPAMQFVVGDLPEVIEHEIDGASVPVEVKLPVTINGRIFPRENVDIWTFHADAGQQITCDVNAKRLGSPLDAELQVFDPAGKPVHATLLRAGGDPRLHFIATTPGLYQARIRDVAYGGLQDYVYRLTITADPYVDSIYPLGGRRGSKVRFELAGHALRSKFADVNIKADASDLSAVQFIQAGSKTNPVPIDLDNLPEILEAEPNDHPADVKPVALPAMLNGRIDHPGDVDYWAVEAKKGETLDLDLRAARLGSPLDSVLSIEDAQGKPLAKNDDRLPGQADSQLTFKVPADGIYYIRVEDRFASRGGSTFAYRLRVAPARPDYRLSFATDAITLPRSGDAPADPPAKRRGAPPMTVKVDVQRIGGFDGPIHLALEGLPQGVSAANTIITARQLSAQVKLTAAPTAKIAAVRVRVIGTAEIGGKSVSRMAALAPAPGQAAMQMPVNDVLLSIAIPTPFTATGEYEHPFIPCGSVHHRHYELDRGGFDGPITISLADRQIRHLQGVTAPVVVIPPGANSFDYWIALAPEMELGRTVRVVFMLTATVKDFDGSDHIVSFSNGEPNNQFVSVATAPLLNVGLDETSLLARPGQADDLIVHIQRAPALVGQPVKIELVLPPQLHDVQADPITLPPSQSQGTLRIRFGDKPGPFTLPALLRATAPGPGDPSRAEVRIELVPARSR
jgi:hypothetical protein